MTDDSDTPETKGILFFDVNETLLDTASLKEYAGKRLANRQDLTDVWFTSLLHYSLVETVTGSWHRFGDIAEAVLEMTAERYGISLAESDEPLSAVLASLPAHPDVARGLSALSQQGFTLVALTNSSAELAESQLRSACIDGYFSKTLSVEESCKYKPDLSVYNWAVHLMGRPASECMLIAAHGWDVGGAKLAGMKTAFIARKGQTLYPLAPKPDFVARDIFALSQIINSLTGENI